MDSKSSFLPNSFPLCAAIEAYLDVPIKGYLSLKGLININLYKICPFLRI